MPTRFINNVRDEGADISFDLVVRDEFNITTYGGGRVTLAKAAVTADAQLETAVEAAVASIIREGNTALPRTRAPEGVEPDEFVRRLHALAVRKNLEDRPTRRDPFGER